MFAVERLMVFISTAMLIAVSVLSWYKGTIVEFGNYNMPMGLGIVFCAVAAFYRTIRLDEKISTICGAMGLFVIFSTLMALHSQLVLPIRGEAIDSYLAAFDASLGFSWPKTMIFMADYPILTDVMGYLYDLVLVFVLSSFFIIGVIKSRVVLHEYTVAMTFAAITTIFLWSFFPGAGASAYWTLPADVENAIQPRVGTVYGSELLELYATGFSTIDAMSVKGLVGFPSFHTVMFIIPAVFLAKVAYLRWFAVAFCVLGLPTVMVQGGHHLSDAIAGALISFASIALAKFLVRYLNNQQKQAIEIGATLA